MSTWVTPAGTIGTTTQQRVFTFTFSATPSLGGVLNYEIVGSWPPGSWQLTTVNVSPGVYNGVLTATPSFVSIATTYDFVISATEITSMGATPNPRTFSVTVSNTVWQTEPYLGGYTELSPLNITLYATPSIAGNKVVYSLLNGALPVGQTENTPLTLNTVQLSGPSFAWVGIISGTPGQVSQLTTSDFTVRAIEYNGSDQQVSFRDRTFSIDISGTTAPSFVTPAGTTWVYYDSTWVYNALEYQDPDPGNTTVISLASGSLPPGLEITPAGVIRGYADIPSTASVTYNFTLRIASRSGENLSAFNITINNQSTIPGFAGRPPSILNNRPLTIVPEPNDPYTAYYLSGQNLGSYVSNNYFAFKFIGHDFDGQELTYELIPSSALASSGLVLDVDNGWLSGNITAGLTPSVDTYNFAVAVYKTSNPAIRSQNFQFTIVILNNIDVRVEWLTEQDLGSIQNGEVSVLGVQARSLAGKNLSYRLVGNDFTTDFRTIVYNNSEFQALGLLGGYANSIDGQTWQLNTDNQLAIQRFNIQGSVYNPFTGITVVVGNNVTQSGVFAQSIDGINWNYGIPPSPVPTSINGIAFNGSSLTPVYVMVGTNGFVAHSTDAANWTVVSSTVTADLNKVYYDGSMWVAVGNDGTLIHSTDNITWTATTSTYTVDFDDILKTGSRWIIVGQLGTLIVTNDITNSSGWVLKEQLNLPNLKSIVEYSGTLVVVGTNGTILSSTDNGENWIQQASNTFNDLYDVYYDGVLTNKFWTVGDVGTIIDSTDGIVWTSPTISDLPPYLHLDSDGGISGRLAFESQTSVIPENTDTVYEFTVQAYCTDAGFEEISSVKHFRLTTYQKFPLPYDNLYIKALVSTQDRAIIESIISDTDLIPENNLFRPQDPYFGRAKGIVYQHMFGVPSMAETDLYTDYIAAVTKNHYWRNITLGPIRTAQARNSANEVVYEVVYSQVIDNLVNNSGVSISKEILWPRDITVDVLPYYTSNTALYTSMYYSDPEPDVKHYGGMAGSVIQLDNTEGITVGMFMTGANVTLSAGAPPQVLTVNPGVGVTVDITQTGLLAGDQLIFSDPVTAASAVVNVRTLYPNSLPNMRAQIADVLGFINDPSILPLWMSSQQADGNILGYTQAWVICYTKPGYAQTIANNINTYLQNNNVGLNQIDFKIDRFEVDRSQTYGFEGGTAVAPVWNDLPSPGVVSDEHDAYIYFPQKTILPSTGVV